MSFIYNIPNYVKAKTEDGLRKKMLEVNLKKGAFHKFFSVYFDGKNHIAWFVEEKNSMNDAIEVLDKK
jgi:hypothetical protein